MFASSPLDQPTTLFAMIGSVRLVTRSAITRAPQQSTSLARHFTPCATRASSPPTPTRAPTFTTPEVVVSYAEEDTTKPLPPTDLPVEDYASPLMHTASIFSTIFRYTVFGSVTVVALSLTGLVAVHMWVEHKELAGVAPVSDEEDPQRWSEEVDGWSGAHRGGGTDPRLGMFARAAVRGAWIAQNWGGASVASPVSSVGSAFGAGGAMIGKESLAMGKEVGDASWQLAEAYLVFALDKAEKKGISLVSDSQTDTPGVDRAAIELEERLAGLREKIGGRIKLEEAREGWERIYYALSVSPGGSRWQKRQQIKATKKLGDISARLAEAWKEGSATKSLEKVKAEGWFLVGLLPALADIEGDLAFQAAPTQSTSLLSIFSRSPSSTTNTIRPEIAHLVDLLDHHVSAPFTVDPATSRAILNSLISLETFLARDRNLVAAQAVQRSSLAFANSLHHSPYFQSDKRITSWLHQRVDDKPTSVLPWEDKSWVGAALSQIFLITRTSLFATHLAEVSIALGQPEPDALVLLQGAINDCERTADVLSNSPYLLPVTGLSHFSGSTETKHRKEFGKGARGIVRDANVTGAMAARLTAFVHETGCGGLAAKKGKAVSKREQARIAVWCGGDAVAEAFYSKAMEFSTGRTGGKDVKGRGEGSVLDERGYREAQMGFERTRKRVLEAEKERR